MKIQEFTVVPRNEGKNTCDNFCSCTTLLVMISSVCRAALFLMYFIKIN